jgi:conjugal transfer pilus assembly protein TrbC
MNHAHTYLSISIRAITRVSKALLVISLALLASVSVAQTTQGKSAAPAMPSDEAISTAMRLQQQRTNQALLNKRLDTDAMKSARPSVPALPNAGAGPNAINGAVDLDALAAQFNQGKADPEAPPAASGLMIFISLSMPQSTLDRLVDQAVAYKVPLTIRGLKEQSFKLTTEAVATLLKKRSAQIHIDPRLFERFAIKQVPAFVVVDPATGASGTVFGDVSVDYALETIARAMPNLASEAAKYVPRKRL